MITISASTFLVMASYFVVGLLGLVSHFLKQKIKGQTTSSIKGWFATHVRDTIISLIAFVVSFLILVQTGDISVLTAFMTGYMADSIFTKRENE